MSPTPQDHRVDAHDVVMMKREEQMVDQMDQNMDIEVPLGGLGSEATRASLKQMSDFDAVSVAISVESFDMDESLRSKEQIANTVSSDFEHISHSLRSGPPAAGTGEDDLDMTQNHRVRVMRIWYYSSAVLAALAGFLLTFFLIEKSLYDWDVEIHPSIYAIISPILILAVNVSMFGFYDRAVKERHLTLSENAHRTGHIVASLFPKVVQRRIWAEAAETKPTKEHKNSSLQQLRPPVPNSFSMMGKMNEAMDEEKAPPRPQAMDQKKTTKPIADLFPEATVFFGDLVGFTAWSSMREPSQVFTLLETIYNEFDEIARRRRVFKVETVGDCYVAVAGLPEPCLNHAQVMARFAWDCRLKMNALVKELEVMLGPDTAELAIRIGLHSGPVTAGVLRGDKARFQLFGDTVNTTSRIETTGQKDKIHVSQECAQLLMNAAKDHWLIPRDDKVTAKGKGELNTYWLRVGKKRRTGSLSSIGSQHNDGDEDNQGAGEEEEDIAPEGDVAGRLSDKHERLVNWITNELATLLKEIEIQRLAYARTNNHGSSTELESMTEILELEQASTGATMMSGSLSRPLDEVQDIITLPKFESMPHDLKLVSRERFEISPQVLTELHTYVHTLATMYPDNPFHNFEHASHVTMSVCKLLSRIVRPADLNVSERHHHHRDVASTLHDHTYGITSDPLTQFAVVLSALIHDVDHPGIPNTQLLAEKPRLADYYNGKSMAEQNSVDLAWTLLMDEGFTNLRSAIYGTPSEFKRFRQLIVNSIMATDIMDKDLSSARKKRWNLAFSDEIMEEGKENEYDTVNRKATIVIEHLIQASDIAHTMQHWHIYRKWNGRLFEEMYKAYAEGRAKTNPADNWYEGEIGFFKFYIIPLAHKLKECGVFGVSGDEYLNYAVQNLREWELNGKNVVSGMLDTMRFKHVPKKVGSESSLVNNPTAKDASGTPPESAISNGTATFSQKPLPKPVPSRVASGEVLISIMKGVPALPKNENSKMTELPEEMRLLFVDDDKITRKLFCRTIKKILPKWVVKEAASGEEALEVLQGEETPFDLIFMDHYMGTDNKQLLGSDAVAELRKRGITSKVCGMSANDVENMFDDAGADEFIFKPLPFRPQPLTRELLRILAINDDWGVVPL